MAYCTLADLTDRYGEDELIALTDRERLGIVDQDVLDAVIAHAGRDIDGALADAGYTPPLEGWDRLRVHAEQLVRAYLYTGQRPEQVEADYRETRAFLAAVSEGRIRPPASLATAGATPTAGEPQTNTVEGVFTDDSLTDY